MNNSLDISIHGPQRIAIIERLVHVCRYSPGLVLLDGDDGRSPVKFLRHMADLLRDELDFALIEGSNSDASGISKELVSQWHIYRGALGEHSNIQSVHHFLDLGLQSGRLALIVVERASFLDEEAMDCLVGMMARHSRLTVLFAGIDDARKFLRRAQQLEVSVNYIDLPDPVETSRPSPSYQPDLLFSTPISGEATSDHADKKVDSGFSLSGFDHAFSDESFELPDEDPDVFFEHEFLVADARGRLEPSVTLQENVSDDLEVDSKVSETLPDADNLISATQKWGAVTWADIRKKRYGLPILVCGCLILVALFLLVVLDLQKRGDNQEIQTALASLPVKAVNQSQSSANQPPPVVGVAQPVSSSSALAPQTTVTALESDKMQKDSVNLSVDLKSAAGSKTTPILRNDVSEAPKKIIENKKISPSSKAGSSPEKLWRSKPENFTIQIAAAHGEGNIKRLQIKLPQGQPHYVFRTIRDGRPWFVLVYGSFPSKQQASAARDLLSTEIKKSSTPWVRKQGEVFFR
jgi:hypothetical protein